jgi:hypothetical protein
MREQRCPGRAARARAVLLCRARERVAPRGQLRERRLDRDLGVLGLDRLEEELREPEPPEGAVGLEGQYAAVRAAGLEAPPAFAVDEPLEARVPVRRVVLDVELRLLQRDDGGCLVAGAARGHGGGADQRGRRQDDE